MHDDLLYTLKEVANHLSLRREADIMKIIESSPFFLLCMLCCWSRTVDSDECIVISHRYLTFMKKIYPKGMTFEVLLLFFFNDRRSRDAFIISLQSIEAILKCDLISTRHWLRIYLRMMLLFVVKIAFYIHMDVIFLTILIIICLVVRRIRELIKRRHCSLI